MLRLKQYFCRHKFNHIAYHDKLRKNLWKCYKCNVYCIQNFGTGLFNRSKTKGEGWVWIYDVEGD